MKQRTKVILHYAKPHKWIFAALFTCIVVTIFSGAVYPYIFGMLVDEVFYRKDMSVFLDMVLLYGVVYLFNQIMHFGLNMSWANLMTRYLFDIRRAAFRRVLAARGRCFPGSSAEISYPA